ncbi:MAG: hypothetical protein OXD54_01150 [Candidatus Poribacteria bacterium]|nr:hypothetical protein [Candidatus Poribacteria bacterium]
MKTTPFWNILKLLLVLAIICNFSYTAAAQNYYPADIGNEWVLERTDGKQNRVYKLEKPEDVADSEYTLLKIETVNPNTNKVVDTDKYFLTSDEEGIKLHKTVLEQAPFGNATAIFTTPAIFFPKELVLGDKWDVIVDANLKSPILEIDLKSTTNFEIVGFEDIVTPAGTFQNCAKIKLILTVVAAGGTINFDPTTSYQWLAPDVGPIKYEADDGQVFEMVSLKLVGPPPLNAQNPPMWQLPSLNFQVSGSRLGDTLSARVLENVEDYVTEVGNLGILSVTGNIVPPGDGTGFATNFQSKQDLWVAGRFTNAPIRGRITLFAENNKGRTTVTIDVTIN